MIRDVITYDNIPEYFKGWGSEKWIHNDEDYCGKELILFEGKKCSIHYHRIKKETFFVVEGKMLVELYDRPFVVIENDLSVTIEQLGIAGELKMETVLMLDGDSLLIEPLTPHRFIGLAEETRFIEISTQHFEEDSYRIWPGDSQNAGL